MHAITFFRSPVLIIIICIITTDQSIKLIATHLFPLATNEQLSNTLITLALQPNYNGFGNVYTDFPYSVKTILLCLPTLLLVPVYIIERKTTYLSFTRKIRSLFALLLAGSVSNLLDRFFYQGAVIDYIAIGAGALQTGYFNLADMCILTAAFGFGFEYCSKLSLKYSNLR